jgi:nicotinate-nucleotide adenylyltransferase
VARAGRVAAVGSLIGMSCAPRRLGILGGTFDPVHVGHLDMADAAHQRLGLTEVVVVTSNVPPHRPQPASSAYHRFAMVALAVQDRPDWRASDVELRFDAPSYTSRTLSRFHERGYDPIQLFFMIGADAFAEIATWKDYPNILEAAHFVVVSRPGYPSKELPERLPRLSGRMVTPIEALNSAVPLIILLDAPTTDVSSTAIRARLTLGESIAGLVPPRVQQHIEQHGLYASMIPGRRASDTQDSPQAGRLHGQN